MNINVESRIEREYEERIFLNRLSLCCVGIWPLERDNSKLRVFFRKVHVFFVYFFMFSVLIPQWCDMYCLWGNIDAYTETLMSNAFIIGVMAKLSIFLKSMRKFKKILETMRSNWIDMMKMPDSREKKQILYELSAQAQERSTKYGFIILFTAISYFIMPILNAEQGAELRGRKYPFFGRYYFDRNSRFIYGLCYISQVMTGGIVGVANFATDTIFLVCIYHFCAQLRILQSDLAQLGCYRHCKDNESARDLLPSLIRRHQAEIRNARVLQSIFSGSSLQQLLVSCLMICVNGFKLIVSLSNRDIDVLMYAVCMPLTLFQILFYCQPGNELVVQSQLLNEAIYQSSWVNLDPVSIRHLVFMIQRSQKPLAITAGKIYVLSLENFMKILKTSMSALSVLQAVYGKLD